MANYLITTYSWQTAYMILGGILAITTIPVALFVVRIHPSEMGLQAYGDTTEATETTAELKGFTLGEAVKTPGFWLLALVLMMIGIMNMGVQHHVPAYLNDMGHSPALPILWHYLWSSGTGKIVLGSIFDRYGSRVGVIFIFTVFALASFIRLFENCCSGDFVRLGLWFCQCYNDYSSSAFNGGIVWTEKLRCYIWCNEYLLYTRIRHRHASFGIYF